MRYIKFLMAALLSIALFACQNGKTPESLSPVLKPAVADDIIVPAEGGEYPFAYILENPVEDGKLSVETEADWIPVLDWDKTGNVIVTVDKNLTEEPREASITVTYDWSDTEAPLSFVKHVKQAKHDGPIPDITLEILELLPGEMTFRVTPADKEMFVVATAALKSYVDYYGKTDDDLFQEDLRYWRECANIFEKPFLEVLGKQGKVGMYEMTTDIGAESGEECCLYAYGCTYEENPVRLTDIVKVYFTAK